MGATETTLQEIVLALLHTCVRIEDKLTKSADLVDKRLYAISHELQEIKGKTLVSAKEDDPRIENESIF